MNSGEDTAEQLAEILRVFYSPSTTNEERRSCEQILEKAKHCVEVLFICRKILFSGQSQKELHYFGLSALEGFVERRYMPGDVQSEQQIEEMLWFVLTGELDSQLKEKAALTFALYQLRRWKEALSMFVVSLCAGFEVEEMLERTFFVVRATLHLLLDNRRLVREKRAGLFDAFCLEKESLIRSFYKALAGPLLLGVGHKSKLFLDFLDLFYLWATDLGLSGIHGIKPSIGEIYVLGLSLGGEVAERICEVISAVLLKKEDSSELFLISDIQKEIPRIFQFVSSACHLPCSDEAVILFKTFREIGTATVQKRMFPDKSLLRQYTAAMLFFVESSDGVLFENGTLFWKCVFSSEMRDKILCMDEAKERVLVGVLQKERHGEEWIAADSLLRKICEKEPSFMVSSICAYLAEAAQATQTSKISLFMLFKAVKMLGLISAELDDGQILLIEQVISVCHASRNRGVFYPVFGTLHRCVPNKDSLLGDTLLLLEEKARASDRRSRQEALKIVNSIFSVLSAEAISRHQKALERIYSQQTKEERHLLAEIIIVIALSTRDLHEKERLFRLAAGELSLLCTDEFDSVLVRMENGGLGIEEGKHLENLLFVSKHILWKIQDSRDDFLLSAIDVFVEEAHWRLLVFCLKCFAGVKAQQQFCEKCLEVLCLMTRQQAFYTTKMAEAALKMLKKVEILPLNIVCRQMVFYGCLFKKYPRSALFSGFVPLFSGFVLHMGNVLLREWADEEADDENLLAKMTTFVFEIIHRCLSRGGEHAEFVFGDKETIARCLFLWEEACKRERTSEWALASTRLAMGQANPTLLVGLCSVWLSAISLNRFRNDHDQVCQFLCVFCFRALKTGDQALIDRLRILFGGHFVGIESLLANLPDKPGLDIVEDFKDILESLCHVSLKRSIFPAKKKSLSKEVDAPELDLFF
eukprot:GHVN01102091.1.p1 GENE.GHVN01102091.1~~GHVN01102091.1.p1  ORF type:complete len:926 (-),score=103.36 GHVN01102091.1:4347-7124(-)